ncbi:MAG: protein-export chaperone SecB [Lentisphaerae bacterium]|nr:protein-export chaperone SecB [Lentisphaerota bacterium]
MEPSALQLSSYFVAELNVTANREHDPKNPVALTDKSLVITPGYLPDKSDPRRWQVSLRIQQQAGPAANAPYFFTIELVSLFAVAASYPEENIEWMVRTNATSVLYSTAREVLRGAMAQGPFCPLLLPTMSFYTPETKKLLDAANAKKATGELPPMASQN